MALTVEVQTTGVLIKNDDKGKQIYLQPKAWECLMECKNQIEQALRLEKEHQWNIDAEKDIRVHTNNYQGQCYLHIRHWWKDRPTKMGVAVLKNEWKDLKSYMVNSPETTLGISVLKTLLQEKVSDIIHAACEGCDKSWPSQKDHECLQDTKMKAELCIDKALTELAAIDFISALAQEARKEKLILEIPHQTLKRILQFHSEGIKDAVLEQFDY